jgi:predicted phage replisome organizer
MMRERKNVKFRCDMYSDTKFKIIDMKPERDMIHYIWMALVLLAGKVNMAGELYMSRNLPYTIETLAIEFNRDKEQVKLALQVFIELEMIEVTDDGVYRVKNFAKHQNIKVEEKVKFQDKEISVKNIEVAKKAVIANEDCNRGDKKSENEEDKNKESKNDVAENEKSPIINEDKSELEINNSETNKENHLSRGISHNISHDNIPISFEINKKKKAAKRKKKEEAINVTDEEDGENKEMFSIKEGEFVLGEGEKIVSAWTF